MQIERRSFEYPSKISGIVCCDFDETYLPFNPADRSDCGIHDLECFIGEHAVRAGLIIGWVTGSSLASVLRKSEGFAERIPHFIAGSLGSEFYWVRDNRIVESQEWTDMIRSTGFGTGNIGKVVDLLGKDRIVLTPQGPDYQGKYMKSYYYRETGRSSVDLARMKAVADHFNVKVLMSGCNPLAGDPAGYFDVHFLPRCCGKEQVLLFLCEHLGVEKKDTYAFGDSFNDLEMLDSAGNSFLVGNADPAVKEVYPFVLAGNYCKGIREKMEELIGIKNRKPYTG